MNPNTLVGQTLIILNGPSCGGKTSVADALADQCTKLFVSRRDRIKWLVSDYASGKYQRMLEEMVLALVEIALQHELSVVYEGFPEEKIQALAEKHEACVYIVNISAPDDVLHARFAERVKAEREGARIANTDPKRFADLLLEYNKTKSKGDIEFDSSQKTAEQIAQEILTYITSDERTP